MQVLENLTGGANHQHGEHTIRIETGSHGTEIRVGNRSLHYGPGGVNGAPNVTAPNTQTIESTPQPTLNRWQEEEKIVAVIDAQDRLNKIINHIVNVLLPAARKADEEAKTKKAEAEAARKRKEEEEEAAMKKAEEKKAEEEARLRRESGEQEAIETDEAEAAEETEPAINSDVDMAAEGK